MLAITDRIRRDPTRLLAVFACLLALTASTRSSHAQAPPADDDAAALWSEVFDALEALEIDDESRDLAESQRPGTTGFDPRGQRAALDRYADVMALAGRAARAGEVRFDLNYEDGIGLLLPHLAPMRRVARLMAADAALARFEGDPDRAVGRMDELARLSTQPQDDGTLIGSLVSMAVGSMSLDSIDDAIATGEIGGEGAERLLDALPEPGDPFGTTAAVAAERDLFGASIRRALEGGEPLADLLGDPELDETFGGATPERIDEWMGGLDDAYDAATAAMAEPDPDRARAMFDAFEEDLRAGAYGELALQMVPSMSRVRERRDAMNEMLRETRERLESIARGEDPTRFVDAAPLYRRAFVLLRDLRPREQMAIELVRASAAAAGASDALAGVDAATLETATTALERDVVRRAIELLARASAIERCSFDESRWGGNDSLLLDTVEGFMRMGARLLLVDGLLAFDAPEETVDVLGADRPGTTSAGAARRTATRDEAATAPADAPDAAASEPSPSTIPSPPPPPDGPADRFAQVVAMSAHLAGREHLGSSLVAQSMLGEALALRDALVARAAADDPTPPRWVDRLARHDVTDPLGWKAARTRAERAATDALSRRRATDEPAPTPRGWTLERLAVLLTDFGETLDASLPSWEDAPMRSLDDLVDRARLEALADELASLRRPWERGDPITVAEIAALDAPPIAPFTRAAARAHARVAALIDAVDAFEDAVAAPTLDSD